MKFYIKKNLFFLIIIISAVLVSFSIQAETNFRETLINELSSRHRTYDKNSLIILAGSEDNLVSELLSLRRLSKPPSLGPNSEKFLILFSQREDVKNALLDDVSDSNYFGLGSVVLSSISSIPDKQFRNKIVNAARIKTKSNDPVSKRYMMMIEEIPKDLLE